MDSADGSVRPARRRRERERDGRTAGEADRADRAGEADRADRADETDRAGETGNSPAGPPAPNGSSRSSPVPAVSAADRETIAAQLGREPRAVRAVAHRCPSGHPTVIQTSPRLPDGTPFPTLYYLTCPRLAASVSRLEASGLMREMTARLATDPDLAAAYLAAHRAYLAERDAIEPLGTEVSAGGMPGRVKCLHVHVAHALAAGPGVNPIGDQALDLLRDEWPAGGCVTDRSVDACRTKGQH